MSNCRSGCKTQDHQSYAECCRAAAPITKNSTQSADAMYHREAINATEINEYKAARAQGIQPATTRLPDIRAAVVESRKADAALTMRS
jgi:hypothetical protein